MTRYVSSFLLSLCAAFLSAAEPPRGDIAKPPRGDVVVSPQGDDAAAGTAERPVKSLAKAQELLRQKLAAGADKDLVVLLRGGTYRLAAPLEFGPADSAPPGKKITYAAWPGEEVVVSGGGAIGNWRVAGNIWEADLPAEWKERPIRELYVGGHRRTLAREPNAGYVRVAAAGPGNRTSFRYQGQDLKNWPDAANAEIVFLHDWSISIVGVKAIDEATSTITFDDPIGCNAPHYVINHYEPHPRYFLQNARSFLDAPGEWHVDRAAGKIRYWPMPGEDPEKVVVELPRLGRLLGVRGETLKPVRGLTFSGIAFRHCAWSPPAHGYAEGQANFHEQRDGVGAGPGMRMLIPGAVMVDLAEDCTWENCRFEQLGSAGIYLRQECHRNVVRDCAIRDVASNGILVGEIFTRQGPSAAGPMSKDLVASRNTIEGCTIERCGQLYYGAVGIWVGIAAETKIARNEIHHLPYTGVSLGWVWNPTPSGCRDNVVEGNHIHDVLQSLSDGGGIYMLGRQPGSILRGNWIHGVPLNAGRAESNGIFLDEGSSEILVEGNLIHEVVRSPIRFHKSLKNTLRGNRLVCRPGIPEFQYNATDAKSMTYEKNTRIEGEAWSPPADDPARQAGPKRTAE